jgi:hypothetical protein
MLKVRPPGPRRNAAQSRTPRECAAQWKPLHGSSLGPPQGQALAFATPWGFERIAPRLAYMLDSLVRVSRRVETVHNLLVAGSVPNTTGGVSATPRYRQQRATQQAGQPLQTAGDPFESKPHRPPHHRWTRTSSPGQITPARMRGQVPLTRSGSRQSATSKSVGQAGDRRATTSPTISPTRSQRPGCRCYQEAHHSEPHNSHSPTGRNVLLGRPYRSRPRAQRAPAQRAQRPAPGPYGQSGEANTTQPRHPSSAQVKGP